MENINKKIIVFAIISILLISIILVIKIYTLKQKNNEIDDNILQNTEKGSSFLDTYGDINIDESAYFDINACISKYLDIINIEKDAYYMEEDDGTYIRVVEENEVKNNIYQVLSQNYIDKNNITIENVYNHIDTIDETLLFVPLEAKIIQNDDIKSFLVHGILEKVIDCKEVKEIFLILNIDPIDNIFSVEPINKTYNSIEEMNITNNEVISIQKNENNTFSRQSISAQTKVEDYVNIFKRLALGRPDILYEKLDNEYKEKRFGTIKNFKTYIDDNRQEILDLRVKQYLFNQYTGYTEYVAKDKYENVYIFNEKSILNYNIKLDNYTINTEKFIKEYESADAEKKAQMNIDKFIQMINRQDYMSSYNCISNGFKSNYFDTQMKFEEFINEKFFKYNKFKFVNCDNKGNDIFIFKMQLTDLTGESSDLKEIDIIIKINDNFDFEMSFGM